MTIQQHQSKKLSLLKQELEKRIADVEAGNNDRRLERGDIRTLFEENCLITPSMEEKVSNVVTGVGYCVAWPYQFARNRIYGVEANEAIELLQQQRDNSHVV